eukprot:GHVL01021362.1.p1 GENE.GHVL01021362.1~~GHVL01021362.1.p1  ORF type:complete len:922 (+),score=129.51 GHVL01021362.1:691-3456(+)
MRAKRLTILERQESILEKAVSGYNNLISFSSYDNVVIKLMNIRRELYEPPRVLQLWDEWLNSSEICNSLKIWRAFLNFASCTFSIFSKSEFRGVAMVAIERLRKEQTNSSKNLDECFLEILQCLSVVDHLSGNTFHAFTVWQLLWHINLVSNCCDGTPGIELDDVARLWDSEIPRIGEKDSAQYLLTTVLVEDSALTIFLKELLETSDKCNFNIQLNDDSLKFKKAESIHEWVEMETVLDEFYWLPDRMITPSVTLESEMILQESLKSIRMEDDEEQSEISFGSVAPFFYKLASAWARRELVLRFLDLMGFPSICRYSSKCEYRNKFEEDFFAPSFDSWSQTNIDPVATVIDGKFLAPFSKSVKKKGVNLVFKSSILEFLSPIGERIGWGARNHEINIGVAWTVKTMTKILIDALILYPSEYILYDCLLWLIHTYSALFSNTIFKSLFKIIKEDPFSWLTHGQFLYCKPTDIESGRQLFYASCSQTFLNHAPLAMLWAHLELTKANSNIQGCYSNIISDIMPHASNGIPTLVINIICCFSEGKWEDFNKSQSSRLRMLSARRSLEKMLPRISSISSFFALLWGITVVICALNNVTEAYRFFVCHLPNPEKITDTTKQECDRSMEICICMLIQLVFTANNPPAKFTLLRESVSLSLEYFPANHWLLSVEARLLAGSHYLRFSLDARLYRAINQKACVDEHSIKNQKKSISASISNYFVDYKGDCIKRSHSSSLSSVVVYQIIDSEINYANNLSMCRIFNIAQNIQEVQYEIQEEEERITNVSMEPQRLGSHTQWLMQTNILLAIAKRQSSKVLSHAVYNTRPDESNELFESSDLAYPQRGKLNVGWSNTKTGEYYVGEELGQLCTRAIQSCPYSKKVWLTHILCLISQSLDDDTADEAIISIVEQLIQKGVRVSSDPLAAYA